MKLKYLYVSGLISLLLGGQIYLLFRPTDLVLFFWLRQINLFELILEIRNSSYDVKNIMPDWVLYALPNGLWMFSYVVFVLAIWNRKPSKLASCTIILLLLSFLLIEVGQLLKFVSGTFDAMDLCAYLTGASMAYLFAYHKPLRKILSDQT